MQSIELLRDFFSKNMEGYNGKTVTNLGGFKLWWEQNWKKRDRIFISDILFNAIKDMPVSLYIMSRAQIGENGRAVLTPNGNGVQRNSIGLMLYTQFNQNDRAAKQFAAKILQDLPMLEGYVHVGTDIRDAIAPVSQVTFRNQLQVAEPLRPEGCIFLVIPSGSEQSSQLWGYRTKATTKKAIAERSTANVSGDDIDLTNLS